MRFKTQNMNKDQYNHQTISDSLFNVAIHTLKMSIVV